ncbi:MAG: hypothetical protein H6515_14605 [Microthrixaceae bacterium]|nr:hypothetical protein [Microthrixaceae bacterium]
MIDGLELVGLDPHQVGNPIGRLRIVDALDVAAHAYVDVAPDPATLPTVVSAGRSGALIGGRRYELAGIRTGRHRTRLVWEDAWAQTLRRARGMLSIPAGSTTITELATRLAAWAGVPADIDPDAGPLHTPVQRTRSSWDLLRALPGVRTYTTPAGLVVGRDTWLHGRRAPYAVAEDTDAVRDIDVHLDSGLATATATLLVDQQWPAQVGDPITLDDLDDAPWLVASIVQDHGTDTATATATRAGWAPEGVITWP